MSNKNIFSGVSDATSVFLNKNQKAESIESKPKTAPAKKNKSASDKEKNSSVCNFKEDKTVNTTLKGTKKAPAGTEDASIPRYMVLTKEPKTKRINLVARPTLFEDFKKATSKNGQSVNDAINELMELYVNKNGNIHTT